MSYSVYIYRSEVKTRHEEGLSLDEFEHPFFSQAVLALLIRRLVEYGYRPQSDNAIGNRYVKDVAGCPIQLGVYKTEIVFSVPYWESSKPAIFEARQDATELSDSDGMVFYDPQTGEWTE